MASKSDLEQLFHEADKDKSGSLTLQELCSAMRRLGYTGSDDVIKVCFGTPLLFLFLTVSPWLSST